MRTFVAAARLTHAVLHMVHGALIIKLRFGGYPAAKREARIAWWSAKLLRVLGLELKVHGTVPDVTANTLVVSNHVSWLDIAAIHAVMPQARFVSKADVLRWPVIGSMVAGAGTLFIQRERKRDAVRVVHHMAEALGAGQTVAVFPEATVSDGGGLLPFHANLFQAAVSQGATVLPLCLRFSDEAQRLSTAANYLGETTLLQSAWRLTKERKTVITVSVLSTIETSAIDRRTVAEASRLAIQSVLDQHRA